MFNWLHKLLGQTPAQPQATEPPPSAALSPATPLIASDASPATSATSPVAGNRSADATAVSPPATQVPKEVTDFNVQTTATQWVFSLIDAPGQQTPVSGWTLPTLADAIERISLDTTRAADWVPRVPMVLPGLLRSLRNEHSSAHDLAQLIEQDVSLLAEALKEANSALYQRQNKVTQTEDAVRLLGNQGLRMLIARVAFRPVLGADAGPMVQAGASRAWGIGEACAHISRDLAQARGVDPFEAFLAGLALNIGHVVALRMADRMAHLARQDAHGLGPRQLPVGDPATDTDDTRNHQAAQDVAHVVALLSHRVAARWELPDNVVGTLTAQIDPMARFQWPLSAELLSVAQETARLKLLDQAGLLPAPLQACWHHLPEDAQQWLAEHPNTPDGENTRQSADN